MEHTTGTKRVFYEVLRLSQPIQVMLSRSVNLLIISLGLLRPHKWLNGPRFPIFLTETLESMKGEGEGP